MANEGSGAKIKMKFSDICDGTWKKNCSLQSDVRSPPEHDEDEETELGVGIQSLASEIKEK